LIVTLNFDRTLPKAAVCVPYSKKKLGKPCVNSCRQIVRWLFIAGASSFTVKDISSRNGDFVDFTGSAAGSFNSGVPSEMGKDVRSLLVFQLGSCAYAFDIHQVKQIIPLMKLTTLPKTEPVFEGIANIHGQFVPVVNTRRCLGLAEMKTDLYTPIILTQSDEQVIGLIVDQVSGVASLRGEQVVHPEKVLPEGVDPPDILVGVAYLSGQMVMVIDPRLLLNEAQVQSLLEALQALCGSALAEACSPPGAQDAPGEAEDASET
jgi:purine-binding chemotaxis protein CheW